MTAGELSWQKNDRGSVMAVLCADSSRDGYSFIRYKLPPHWDAPPHTHPSFLIVTIYSGTLYAAYGEGLARSAAKAYGPGSFIAFPAGTKMLEFTGDEETIIDVQRPGRLSGTDQAR